MSSETQSGMHISLPSTFLLFTFLTCSSGVPGFTVIPGNYTETIEAASNSTLKDCFEACKKNETTAAVNGCQSIAFGPKYTDCLFFDRVVQETQLVADNSSYFIHYDLGCKNLSGWKKGSM